MSLITQLIVMALFSLFSVIYCWVNVAHYLRDQRTYRATRHNTLKNLLSQCAAEPPLLTDIVETTTGATRYDPHLITNQAANPQSPHSFTLPPAEPFLQNECLMTRLESVDPLGGCQSLPDRSIRELNPKQMKSFYALYVESCRRDWQKKQNQDTAIVRLIQNRTARLSIRRPKNVTPKTSPQQPMPSP